MAPRYHTHQRVQTLFHAPYFSTKLDGAKLTAPAMAPDTYPYRGILIDDNWVLIPTTWRLVTSAPGEPLSGWEGTARFQPWTHPARWPSAVMAWYTGTGFGAYKGVHIEWSFFHSGQLPAKEYMFSGLISQE
jgi:hypothetical protein